MRPDEGNGQPGLGDDARAALAAWRDQLADTGAADRLIDLPRAGADLVEITGPGPEAVTGRLRAGRDWSFGPGGGDVLATDLPADTLHTLLRHLRRHAHQETLDHGEDTLHLATGLLHWTDRAGAGHASPILLTAVELVALGPGDVPRLRAATGDPVLNPALAARLREHRVELTADLGALRERITGRNGWRIVDTVVLARFDLAAEAVRQDLAEHEDLILAHPVVRALAAEDGDFAFPPATGEHLEGDEPPLLLDADADQRACVAAALAGHSFVIDGPPGTGKSQTVANMIGALTHAGKRVLFVAETASALDVVQHRLAAAGLGNYLLDLHGQRAGRKQVAAALAAALEAVPLPPPGMDETDRRTLAARREQLTSYAQAVNEPREPLGLSLHQVAGRHALLSGVPESPAPGLQPLALTETALDRVLAAAEQLSGAWRPATERSGFRWREVIEKEPLDGALHEAQVALEALTEATEAFGPLAAAFHVRLPVDAEELARLVAHAATRPAEVPDHWLTAVALRPIREAADTLARLTATAREAAEQARERTGLSAAQLAEQEVAELPEQPTLNPPAVGLASLTAATAKSLAGRFAADADELEHQQRTLDRVTGRLGLPDVVTFSDVELVTLVAELGARPDKPEPAWFSPGAQAGVHAAAGALRRHVEAVAEARNRARQYFTDAVLGEPVEELAERFATVHRGVRKLLAAHRWDRETVTALAEPGVSADDAVANLPLAVAWRRANEGLLAAERQNAALLGRYWQRLDTDFLAIGRALETVSEVLRVTPPEALDAVIAFVCHRGGDGELLRVVTEARDVFRHWRATPEVAQRPELGQRSVGAAVAWLRAQVGPLGVAAGVLEQLSKVTGRELDLGSAEEIVAARTSVVSASRAVTEALPGLRALLGDVDLGSVDRGLAWAAAARTLRSGADAALTAEQAAALRLDGENPDLSVFIEVWQEARQRIIDAFGPARQVRLGTALDRYETARDLLRDLREDDTGQREWFQYLAAREVLAEHGLDSAIDHCADHGVEVGKLRPVLERTVYRAWADAVIAEDERLQPLTSVERNELVEEFRRLDADLMPDAAGTIIEALNARRPAITPDGAPALIRAQEGRLPVRELLDRTWEAAVALKPCFVMPPAAVSRYLPADQRFDVVIIDEASRMTPGAAVACAYRGRSLIVIGDDCQLPPANGQPSVLVAANDCGAFTRLALTRHYRSRHETLISFANEAFYQGRLVTYPSAHPVGDDLGLALLPAVDAPVEAALVAERVAHHFTTRPTLSLGVVTLTPGHADAVADAVETVLGERPDLERFLGEDPLTGFFVKPADAVQGDERDVIILATGPDLAAAGGPVGARKLNVAITRARQRVEVVTSVSERRREEPADEGERRLADYLAPTAAPAAATTAISDIAEYVASLIEGWGFAVTRRAGAGHCRIDIGVRHSTLDAYALGVQCDGPEYAGTPARDRDRLREQVLHALGWHLHRVWSVAWYHDRAEEEARLRAAIENALAVPDVFAEPDLELVTRPAQPPEWALPYQHAQLEPLPPAARVNDQVVRTLLERTVETIAEVEGPVHIAVLTRRIREGWGINRITQPIRQAIEAAIASSTVGFDGTFITAAVAPIPAVRVPGDGVARKPEQVAESELQLALEYLVLDAGLVESDDLLAAAARLFGWPANKTGSARLAAMLDDLVAGGRLIAHRNGLIAAPENDLLDLPDPATLPHRPDAATVDLETEAAGRS
ncbi:regulator [Actinoplanes sp. SE50]|uniref:DUF3320 domain-containing protein n=1 Tax=unclassified Actinoplanes TaxID=2626549 RepID=UPI00023EC4D5|nr:MULTISPECIES: DUF3320 domain-containing protein [unclassified Actinoplanes]AEV86399.1 Regulator of nonsense transcripts-like protein [Actinoplanes sp. SE50/110]ATO84796.1 regulator [Actinoplanes sp. SE50]SLM02206.1 hypothetical protein ACSP50_5444 [Actinoplanes sp. SE50/110]